VELSSLTTNHICHMKLLIKNQNNKDRLVRLIISLLLIPSPMIFGETKWTMFTGFIGLALLFNALSGNCYIYRIFGVSSCKIPKR